jgi:hypothetical protein
MKTIILKQSPLTVTQVDDEDYKLLNQFVWQLWIDPHRYKYAVRYVHDPGGLLASDTKRIYMHRYILDMPDSLADTKEMFGLKLYVVHKDKNGLNNQRSNLLISRRSRA